MVAKSDIIPRLEELDNTEIEDDFSHIQPVRLGAEVSKNSSEHNFKHKICTVFDFGLTSSIWAV